MKTLSQITEDFKISKNTIRYTYKPNTIDDLTDIINSKYFENKHYLNLTDIDVSEFTEFYKADMYTCPNIFKDCEKVKIIDISGWKPKRLEQTACMFEGLSNLTKIIGIEYLNVSNVSNMSSMFAKCEELEYLDVSHWNVQSVIRFYSTFKKCKKLKIDGLENWNVNMKNVVDTSDMFRECNKSIIPSWYRLKTPKH